MIPSIFPRKLIACLGPRSYHISSVSQLLKKEGGYQQTPLNIDNRDSPATLWNYFSRSQRNRRQRIRDGVSLDWYRVQSIYECGYANYIYMAQGFNLLIGVGATIGSILLGLQYSGFEVATIEDVTYGPIQVAMAMTIVTSHCLGISHVLLHAPIRIYYDEEEEIYQAFLPHLFLPLRTRALKIEKYSCTKWEMSSFYFFPWNNNVFRLSNSRKKLILDPGQFATPYYFNQLLRF